MIHAVSNRWLGGQLALVSAAHSDLPVAGIALIACGSAWFRSHPGWRSARHLVVGLLFAGIAKVMGYWPGDALRFGGRQSARLMVDCARQTATGRCTTPQASGDYDRSLAEANIELLVVDIEGDWLTPPSSTTHLCNKAASATITRESYAPPEDARPSPHFAWARRGSTLAKRLATHILG